MSNNRRRVRTIDLVALQGLQIPPAAATTDHEEQQQQQ
ncbi:uncharacterized protein Dwil_GK27645, partial [Drosophila willistoni]